MRRASQSISFQAKVDLFDDLPAPSQAQTIVKAVAQGTAGQDTVAQGDAAAALYIVAVDDQKSCSTVRKRSLECDEKSSDVLAKKLATDAVYMKAYAADRKGEREEMQDAHTILQNFLPEIVSQGGDCSFLSCVSYFAVFDGHSGARASKYSAQHLHKILAQKFPKGEANFEKDMRRCLVESYKKLDENFLAEARVKKPSWKDGSTAVSVLVVDNTLYVANVGDSKAILCRRNSETGKYSALSLSVDHSPSLYEERMRIQKAGGHVREGRMMGVLEVSRSIGDGSFKNHGLSCVPDIKKCQITSDDKYLIVACDGLWKRFDNESAMDFVNKILEDESIQATDTKTSLEVRWETACNRLANEAVRRLSADNVTVLLIAINHQTAVKQ